ncbi:hypothetical protein [Paenarthrobacter ureafaciens]|uniref:hypothetical protein n=1 Tax=Paenarthrobacter ureafaciens TaxID=37931 RepID=UPI003464DAD7
MTKEPSIEEAVERAKRVQEGRLTTIRGVAEARQNLADIREETARELTELQVRIAERVGAAEREDVLAYNAALSAGWSAEELRKIGFSEPDKKARTRRRAARKPAAKTAGQSSPAAPSQTPSESGDDALTGVEREPVGT